MTSEHPSGAAVESADPDFCIAAIDRGELLRLQEQAEAARWSARWSSATALTRQVGPGSVYVRPIIRERRDKAGAVAAYRCLVLFRDARDERLPSVTTLDVAGQTLRSLRMVELETIAGRAVVDLFALLLCLTDVTPHDGG
jgi:hypothetical protein